MSIQKQKYDSARSMPFQLIVLFEHDVGRQCQKLKYVPAAVLVRPPQKHPSTEYALLTKNVSSQKQKHTSDSSMIVHLIDLPSMMSAVGVKS